MKILYVRPSRSKGYLKISILDGEEEMRLVVSEREYTEAGEPLPSDNLTRDAYILLSRADMRYRAKLKALRVLEYADNSEYRLLSKLLAAKIDRDIAEETVREMVRLGYLSDTRQLRRLIELEANRRYVGPRLIIPKLMAKGYKKKDISLVLSELTSDGTVDFERSKAALIEKKCDGCSPEETKKILYKNGYSVC